MMAYAGPMVSIAFLLGPIMILQGIYAKYFGLSLATIGIVILLARLFDAVTDPLIGYFSDRYKRRTGSRKVFVISGGILFVFSSYFLYTPSENVSAVYFLMWFLAFYFSWTLFEIPHLAWGAELAPDSQARNRIFSFRLFGLLLGQLLFYSVPLLPFFVSDEFTPQTLKWSVFIAGLIMLPLLYICVNTTPDAQRKPALPNQKQKSVSSLLPAILGNRPFLLFVAMFSFVCIGLGMWFTLFFIFVDSYLELGNKLALVYIISTCISILTMAVWSVLAARWGKKNVWGIAVGIMAAATASASFLVPGASSFFPLLVIQTLLLFGFAAYSILVPSMLADIIDYGTWRSGIDLSATYFSVFTLMGKATMAIGGALGLFIAGGYGFDPVASTHAADAIFGLRLAIAWLPASIILLSLVFVALMPINMQRHAIIRRRLDARTYRAQVAEKKRVAIDHAADTPMLISSGIYPTSQKPKVAFK